MTTAPTALPVVHPAGEQAPGRAPALAIDGLTVAYRRAIAPAVDSLSLTLRAGEVLALVGESGSGKSTTAAAIIGVLPPSATATGAIAVDGEEILGLGEAALRRYLGSRIGYVPQDPMTSLDPVRTIGSQIDESLRLHLGLDRVEARKRSIELLDEVGIHEPERRHGQYPHELSGGMRQRVLIAIALAADLDVLIADEPTSGLDVTVQRTVLDRLDRLTREHATAVLLITHDLGVAHDRADRIAVMHHGRIVETGTADEVLRHPRHEYTRRLIAAAPSLGARPLVEAARRRAHNDDGARPLLQTRGLAKAFGPLTAVDDVNLTVRRGRTLGIVGESGSGKTTLARMVVDAETPTSGDVLLDGQGLEGLGRRLRRERRRRVQYVYQSPFESLDPRLSIERIITEPLDAFRVGTRAERRRRAHELLELVALDPALARRSPVELSGGQRQRVAIARALALSPELLVLDEPVSALDVSVQAQVLVLLVDLQERLDLTYVLISHDLAVIRLVADDVLVLKDGAVVEYGPTDAVLARPDHPYTRALLDAIPGRAAREGSAA